MKKAATAKRAPARKPAAPTRRRLPHPKFIGALVAGLAFLVLGGLLWQRIAGMTLDDGLLRKLPVDSQSAGIARLSEFTPATVDRLANGQILPPTLKPVLAPLVGVDADGQLARDALGTGVAWSESARGTLAVFEVKDRLKLAQLGDKLTGSLENAETARAGETEVRTATLKGTTQRISYGLQDDLLYISSNPQLIGTAVTEEEGFTKAAGYQETADRLPTARGGYVFFSTAEMKSPQSKRYKMVGVAFAKEGTDGDDLTLAVRTDRTIPTQQRLPNGDGRLLAPADLAAASLGGTDPAKFVRLLEQQRQQSDLPKVLSFQKGLANLDRQLGSSLIDTYLAKANGDWSYSRYISDTGSEQWMAVAEFPDAATARSTVDDLVARLAQSVTIPVRREVITVLPDGSQSREVESEGRVPVTFRDVQVLTGAVKTATLPGIGPLNYFVQDKYLLVASEPSGIDRLTNLLKQVPAEGTLDGELTGRATLKQVNGVITRTDPVLDWILAATPSEGDFTLTADGQLSGSLGFGRTN